MDGNLMLWLAHRRKKKKKKKRKKCSKYHPIYEALQQLLKLAKRLQHSERLQHYSETSKITE